MFFDGSLKVWTGGFLENMSFKRSFNSAFKCKGLCTYLLEICGTENQGKRGVEVLGNRQIKDCLGECSPVFKSEVVYYEVVSSKQLFTIASCTSSTRFSERKIKIGSLLFACQGLFHTRLLPLSTLFWEPLAMRSSLFLS